VSYSVRLSFFKLQAPTLHPDRTRGRADSYTLTGSGTAQLATDTRWIRFRGQPVLSRICFRCRWRVGNGTWTLFAHAVLPTGVVGSHRYQPLFEPVCLIARMQLNFMELLLSRARLKLKSCFNFYALARIWWRVRKRHRLMYVRSSVRVSVCHKISQTRCGCIVGSTAFVFGSFER